MNEIITIDWIDYEDRTDEDSFDEDFDIDTVLREIAAVEAKDDDLFIRKLAAVIEDVETETRESYKTQILRAALKNVAKRGVEGVATHVALFKHFMRLPSAQVQSLQHERRSGSRNSAVPCLAHRRGS